MTEDPVDVTPTPVDEVRRLLAHDSSRLGDVFRLDDGIRSPQQIADELNVATVGFVYSYRTQIAAILGESSTTSPTLLRQTLGRISALMKRYGDSLSPDAIRFLQASQADVKRRIDTADPALEAEDEVSAEQSVSVTLDALQGVAGIYAFSYGWYLESPVDPEHGNTLIKVGRAADVGARIRQYTSGVRTHMPEPLALIRAYSVGDRALLGVESAFHSLLATAGHVNPRRTLLRRTEVGQEWFLTNEDFLDAIATALGLRTEYTGRSEFGSE